MRPYGLLMADAITAGRSTFHVLRQHARRHFHRQTLVENFENNATNMNAPFNVSISKSQSEGQASPNLNYDAFLALDEEVASRAVFVIVPGSDGRTDGSAFGAS